MTEPIPISDDDASFIAAAARQLHPTQRQVFAARVHALLQNIFEPGPGAGGGPGQMPWRRPALPGIGAAMPYNRTRTRRRPDRMRALELLAGCPQEGCSMLRTLTLAIALTVVALMPAKAEPTAEKSFAVFYGSTPAVRGLFGFSSPETAEADVRKLSPSERKKFDDRVRRAELADLVLYGQKCKQMRYNQNGVDMPISGIRLSDQLHRWMGALNEANYDHVKACSTPCPKTSAQRRLNMSARISRRVPTSRM
jgi:hypothetical protein